MFNITVCQVYATPSCFLVGLVQVVVHIPILDADLLTRSWRGATAQLAVDHASFQALMELQYVYGVTPVST